MDKPLSTLTKLVLAGAGGLAVVAGPILFLFPTQTAAYFAWTIRNPMSAIFMGANYFGGIGALWAFRSNRWSVARALMPGIFAFAITQLLATLLSISDFSWGHPVAWAWLLVYIVSPPAVLIVYAQMQRGYQPPTFSPRAIPALFRPAMIVFSIISGMVGVALWIWPFFFRPSITGGAVPWWAWKLTPLTAHVVGGWYLAAATLYATLTRQHPAQAIRVALIGVIAATALEVIGAVWYRSAFTGPLLAVGLYLLNSAFVCAIALFARGQTKIDVDVNPAAETA